MNLRNTLTFFCLLIITTTLFTLVNASSGHAQDAGVLILTHGGSQEWNDAVIEAADPFNE